MYWRIQTWGCGVREGGGGWETQAAQRGCRRLIGPAAGGGVWRLVGDTSVVAGGWMLSGSFCPFGGGQPGTRRGRGQAKHNKGSTGEGSRGGQDASETTTGGPQRARQPRFPANGRVSLPAAQPIGPAAAHCMPGSKGQRIHPGSIEIPIFNRRHASLSNAAGETQRCRWRWCHNSNGRIKTLQAGDRHSSLAAAPRTSRRCWVHWKAHHTAATWVAKSWSRWIDGCMHACTHPCPMHPHGLPDRVPPAHALGVRQARSQRSSEGLSGPPHRSGSVLPLTATPHKAGNVGERYNRGTERATQEAGYGQFGSSLSTHCVSAKHSPELHLTVVVLSGLWPLASFPNTHRSCKPCFSQPELHTPPRACPTARPEKQQVCRQLLPQPMALSVRIARVRAYSVVLG